MSRRFSWRAAGGALALGVAATLVGARRLDAQPTLALVGGRWWQHGAYVTRTYYMRDGVLRARRPGHVDGTIDLAGLFVLPAPDAALVGTCSVDAARGALGTIGTTRARPIAPVAYRRPASLGDGAVASFVALRRDPRSDAGAFGDVVLRVRRGCVLWRS